MTPYTPRATNPLRQQELNDYYARLKVTQEVVTEAKGYKLNMYVDGKLVNSQSEFIEAIREIQRLVT